MYRQLLKLNGIPRIAMLFVFMLTVAGCGGSGNLTTELSGTYQTEQGNGKVDINLSKAPSTLTIDGQTFKGVVEKVDKGTNTVHVKVETAGGNMEAWSLQQVWNDEGSALKLKLRRNGTTEALIPVKHS